MIPKLEQVIKHYPLIAAAERVKCGKPCERTVINTLTGARKVCLAAGLALNTTVDRLTRKVIDTALINFLNNGMSRLSAWSYVCQLRALFAKWSLPYYKDEGWRVPKLELPSFRAQAPRYERPSPEMLSRIKNWYARQKSEYWFAATMMLEFAMRNGDVLRLKPENFVTVSATGNGERGTGNGDKEEETGVRHFLSYTPHKTALSSGRRVYWPIHDEIWQQFEDYGGLAGLDVTDETFREINQEIRTLGFHGSKASYELRKICIDHVYQKFGAEAASSISGDTIKTITYFYADPAQPNIGATRIIDLL